MTEGVLVYMIKNGVMLLAMKKRGFGQGKWNAPGGKIKPGETPVEAAIRETEEEVGMVPKLGRELGTITYHDVTFGDWRVHVFRTAVWKGEPIESDEMRPEWFAFAAIPYTDMWDGDDQWLPKVLSDYPFTAEIWSDGNGKATKVVVMEK